MRQSRSRLAVALLIAFASLTTTAHGQASPQAEALFREGRKLLKEGKLAEACAALEGSERAEHNLATIMNLADCREKNQQYAAAWALFLQADSQTRADPARQTLNATAKRRARALEARLSYLTINVPDESRIPELVVTRDGAPVDPAEWNRAIPADGGSHVISGKAPGHESWSTTVTLSPEADKQAVEVPKFKALPQILHRAAPAAARAAAPEPSPFTRRRKIALGVAGGGALVGVAAIVLGASAQSLRNDAVATCPPSACSPANADDADRKNDQARGRAMVANVGFAVAGAAIATGAVLWFTGKPERPSLALAPQVGATTGLALAGSF
jgi:hypothetical protein